MNSKHRVILISGKQGSGKSTTAEALVKRLIGVGIEQTRIFKFAGPLYEMHDAVLSILTKYGVHRPGLVKDGPLLQVLGTEWGRNTVDSNIWVKCAKAQVQNWFDRRPNEYAFAILDDCRFENEFDAFPDAFKIRLECNDKWRKERCSMWRDNQNHPSEIGLDAYANADKFDLTLWTDTIGKDSVVDRIVYDLKV